jgi:hypothetical protein
MPKSNCGFSQEEIKRLKADGKWEEESSKIDYDCLNCTWADTCLSVYSDDSEISPEPR